LEEDNDDVDLVHHPSSAVNNIAGIGGGSSYGHPYGEVASPRNRDKFDKYYVNETSTDENDNDDSEKRNSGVTTMGKDSETTTTMSLGRAGGRSTPTKKLLDNIMITEIPDSESGRDDLERKEGRESTPERRMNKKKRTDMAKKKKQRKVKQNHGDESSSSSSEDEEDEQSGDKGKAGEEEEEGGVGCCAADEPFACQSVACGAGGDGGTSCVVQ
jgi:hypothetical protein